MANQPTKYRKFIVGAASAALVASAVAPVASAKDFSDTKGNTHEAAIDALSDANIITGYEDGTFKPNKTLTRSDVVKMMGKWLVSEGYEVPEDYKTNMRFSDLKASTNDELLKYAAVVKDNGVFNGNNGRLLAGDNMSRENMAVVLVRAFDTVKDINLVEYVEAQDFDKEVTDLNAAKSEARTAINVLDFFDVTTVAQFNPKDTTTRGHFATFLNNFLKADLSKVTGVMAGVESITAINNTHVEVKFVEAVEDLAELNFKIEGLDISNKVIKQTDAKTVVLTTAVQEGGKVYTVTANDKKLGTFSGVSAVVPTAVNVTAKSLQGVIGKDVTVSAQVTVPEGQSKAGVPVTFNIVNDKVTNEKLEAVAYTDDKGVASYTYTRYYASEDNVAAYATNKSSVVSSGKVYWASAIQLAVEEITSGNDLANETKKSYKVKGERNTTYHIAIKENIGVAPDKLTDVKVQNHGTQNFITPYEMSTGATNFATVTTNASGEGSFTIYGSNLEATPIVYLPSSVNSKAAYSPLALQAQAATVKFSRVDRLAITVAGEGTADSAEYHNVPVAYDTNSAGGRMYTATVTDKDGKVAPVGTTAYVTFKTGNVAGDVYFTTGTKNFVKVTAGAAYPITVGKDGKAQFRVAGKGATSYATPTVFLNTAGSTTDVKLETGDISQDAEVTYFKTPIVTNAALKVTDQYGREISSLTAGQDAYFTYQSVDQNGFEYRPGNYTVTEGKTVIIYVQETQPDGTIAFVPKEVKIDSITNNQYVLAFDVTSTFGNAVVKDANGVTLPVHQNLGNTKTYHVNSNAEGKAIVRVTSQSADTVSVNVTGASNILPTQTASVTFVSRSQLPAAYTGVVQSFNVQKNTLTFAGKEPVALFGSKITYTTNNGAHILTDDQFTSMLRTATGTVTVTRIVSGDQVRFDIVNIASTGVKPVDETGSLTDQQQANFVTNLIDSLPATSALKIEDKAAVQSVRAAYNALSAVAKSFVADATLDKLVAAETKIAELEAAIPAEFKITTATAEAANDLALGLDAISYNIAGTVADASVSELTLTFSGTSAATTATATVKDGKFEFKAPAIDFFGNFDKVVATYTDSEGKSQTAESTIKLTVK